MSVWDDPLEDAGAIAIAVYDTRVDTTRWVRRGTAAHVEVIDAALGEQCRKA